MTDHIDEWVSAYIDDELSESERKRVESHIVVCPDCRDLLSDMIEMKGMLSFYSNVEAPDRLEERVMQSLQTKESAQRRLLVWPLALVTVVTLLLFGTVGSYALKLGSILLRVLLRLAYVAGGLLGADPYVTVGLIMASLLLIVGSGISIRKLMRIAAVEEARG
jgi:anti-sigma factor RsiW